MLPRSRWIIERERERERERVYIYIFFIEREERYTSWYIIYGVRFGPPPTNIIYISTYVYPYIYHILDTTYIYIYIYI